jgi:hypothetical protein
VGREGTLVRSRQKTLHGIKVYKSNLDVVYSHGGRKSSSSCGNRCTFVANGLDMERERNTDNDSDSGLRETMLVLCVGSEKELNAEPLSVNVER